MAKSVRAALVAIGPIIVVSCGSAAAMPVAEVETHVQRQVLDALPDSHWQARANCVEDQQPRSYTCRIKVSLPFTGYAKKYGPISLHGTNVQATVSKDQKRVVVTGLEQFR